MTRPTQLLYLGPVETEAGQEVTLGSLLTDGSGVPLAGRAVRFQYGAWEASATTDAWGLARVVVLAGQVPGDVTVQLTYAGDSAFAPAQTTAILASHQVRTRLAVSVATTLAAGAARPVSASLTRLDGAPIAGKAVRFEVAARVLSATTDSAGVATVTVPALEGTGPTVVKASFAGDAGHAPASAEASTLRFLPTGFTVWGGNSPGLNPGQRVNFWGDAWAQQVTGGDYGAQAEFKGWASASAAFALCQPAARTRGTPLLTPGCWASKAGNSSPPATLPEYVGVLVTTAVAKDKGEVYGNVAALAVVRVESESAYGPVPGKPAWGTLVAVVDRGSVFAAPPAVSATQTQLATVLPGQGYEVAVRLANTSSVGAEGVVVREVFSGAVEDSAEEGVGRLSAAESRTVTFARSAPAVAARTEGETAAAYQQRLAASEGRRLLSVGEVRFTDAAGQPVRPVHAYSESRLVLPRLTVALAGPSCVTPGQAVAYTVTAYNAGGAAAVSGMARVVLPDSSEVAVPFDVGAGAAFSKEVAWVVPPLPERQPGESASAYAARLQALDGQVLTATVEVLWHDGQGNAYGPLAQEAAATLEVEVPNPDVPPNPEEVAPPLSTTGIVPFGDAVSFLYTGDNPIQQGVESATLEARRLAVLRGKVQTRDGKPLASVRITVLSHPEFGFTRTREDGVFDLAVNGGGVLTVQYEAEGFLPSQRQVRAPWGDYAWLADVVLVPLDAQATAVDFSGSGAAIQVARGSVQTDVDGSRQATLLFAPGTQATLVLPDGSLQPLSAATFRATEYTVGEKGPASMPGELPAASGYTYAVELSLDEAMTQGAREVRFSKPVAFYVDNFLRFPIGGAVPAGYYDRAEAAWKASDNGRVISVHSVADGVARLDVTGDGQPDSASVLASLGIDEAELRQLASLYAPGKSLWRVPMTHFSPWDCNWPYAPPPGAKPPQNASPQNGKMEDKPECESGSVIECQNQVLGESLPLAGTPFRLHFSSDRMPGRKDKYVLRIPVSGASVPAVLKRMVVEFSVAGRRFTYPLPAAPNQEITFTWDGKDAYGRTVQGEVPVVGRTGYVYPLVYMKPTEFSRSFALFGDTISVADRGSQDATSWQQWEAVVGSAPHGDLAGWQLSVHHQFDARAGILYRGDGGRNTGGVLSGIISTVAGGGSGGDGRPATQARLYPDAIAVGPDGSLYIAEQIAMRVRRVSPDGIISTVAGSGTGSSGFGGDGGPATQARLSYPKGLAVGPDGSLYIADTDNRRVRRVGPDGIISTVAGTGVLGFSGDGGPALQARLGCPQGLAVGPDRSLYIADVCNYRIRRVGPDGIISTVAGNGYGCFGFDGQRATDSCLYFPHEIALGSDGSLYISDYYNYRVRKVGTNGIISTVAGSSFQGFSGDGFPATQARMRTPTGVAMGSDGVLYVADSTFGVPTLANQRIRRVGTNGIISTMVGTGVADVSGDGVPAAQAPLYYPRGLALGPDGSLYIAESGSGRVLVVRRSSWTRRLGEVAIASSDGREVYVFDDEGRHLRTQESLTGALRYRFGYDTEGRLTSITDGDGLVTRIERDPEGRPLAIVAPREQRTQLALDANGYLASLTHPAGATVQLKHSAEGLLTSMTDARGGLHTYAYDGMGRLEKDTNPAGGHKALVRTGAPDGSVYVVTLSTALGATTRYETQQLPQGGQKRIITAPDGTITVRQLGTDGTTITTDPDGTVTTEVEGPDARFGMQAPLLSSVQVRLPSGLTSNSSRRNAVTYVNRDPTQGLASLSDTLTHNGRTYVTTYTAATRTLQSRSPAGQTSTTTLDAKARVVGLELPGVLPVTYTYDARGRMAQVAQGAQSSTYAYDARDRLVSRTDAAGAAVHYGFDDSDRLVSTRLPSGRTFRFAYDAQGNRTRITMPNGAIQGMTYTATNLLASYEPPLGASTLQSYDLDMRLTRATLPSGKTVDAAYASSGRLTRRSYAEATVDFSYGEGIGQLATMTRTPLSGEAAQSLAYTYDGRLVKTLAFAGPATGRFTYRYDPNFFLQGVQLDASPEMTLAYDADGMVTRFGPFTWTRGGPQGATSRITDSVLTTSFGHDTLGRIQSRTDTVASAPLYASQLTYDAVGRIVQKVESIAGVPRTFTYAYDADSQLRQVSRDGVVIEQYAYDANGNRMGRTPEGSSVEVATYDGLDRLQQRGSTRYTFDADGFMTQRGSEHFSYSTRGELLLYASESTTVTYGYDGLGRRTSRSSAAGTEQYLYGNPSNPFQVTHARSPAGVTTQLFYDEQGRLFALERKGTRYYVGADPQGTPRVVSTASGAGVKSLDYDAFGTLLSDSAPGFELPIGFAGGLQDPDSGLVRFGLRDYEPASGRWTARDPLLFDSAETNLYLYVSNNPVNLRDPMGLLSMGVSAFMGLGAGASVALTSEGMSICVEVGAGLGESASFDPFGGLEASGVSVKASAKVEAGPVGIEAKGEIGLTSSGSVCKKGKVGVAMGATTWNIGEPGVETEKSVGERGNMKYNLPKGVTAQVKGSVQACKQMRF